MAGPGLFWTHTFITLPTSNSLGDGGGFLEFNLSIRGSTIRTVRLGRVINYDVITHHYLQLKISVSVHLLVPIFNISNVKISSALLCNSGYVGV
jgi:hypothetical protein